MIVNSHKHQTTENDVYIGRGSKWGNPFKIGVDGSREEVIEKYHEWIITRYDLTLAMDELVGKTLVCFCKPQACHGDVLETMVNEWRLWKKTNLDAAATEMQAIDEANERLNRIAKKYGLNKDELKAYYQD